MHFLPGKNLNGSISLGRGKWPKCGIFLFQFRSSAVTKRFDFSTFLNCSGEILSVTV